jgi:hypothetical protein
VILPITPIIALKRWRKKKAKKQLKDELSLPIGPSEHENIEICGRVFPKSTVKDFSDISFRKEIGTGNFGKVFKGVLDLSEYQR